MDSHENSPLKENPLKEDRLERNSELESTGTLQDIDMSNQFLDKASKAYTKAERDKWSYSKLL